MFKVYIQTSTFQIFGEDDLDGIRFLQAKGGDTPINLEHLRIFKLFREHFPHRVVKYDDILAYESLVLLGATVS
jgi:hypothetical protein